MHVLGLYQAFNAVLIRYQGFPDKKNRRRLIVASYVTWIWFPYRQRLRPYDLCQYRKGLP